MSIIGNPILIGGGSSKSLFNFPITIASTEPTAEIEGHIWINTTRGNNITSVHIVDSPTSDLPNNSLIFEVCDTRNVGMTLVQDFKAGNIGTVQISYECDATGNHPWLVGSDGENSTYLAYPRVFIKIDDVLYLETAYVWTGTYWMLLSQADAYLFSLNQDNSFSTSSSISNCPINVYNIAGTNYTLHGEITASTTDRSYCLSVSDANGMYVAYQDEDRTIYVYKRVGDTFTLYFSMLASELCNYLPETYANYYYCQPSSSSYAPAIKLSSIGDYFAITYLTQPESSSSSSGYTRSNVLILKNNGTTYVYHSHFEIDSVYCSGGSNSPWNSRCSIYASDDFSVLAIGSSLYDYETNGNSYTYTHNYVLIGSPDSYTLTRVDNYYNQGLLCAISKDGSCAVFMTENTYSSEPNYYYYVYSIDKNSNSIKNIGTLYYRSYYDVVKDMYISADNHIWLVRQSNSTTGEVAYLEHGKVENGVFTKLTNNYTLTDGNENKLFTSYNSDTSGSSYVYYDMCIDVKNNLLYISSRWCIYVCEMVRAENGSLTSYTLKTTISPSSNYVLHNKIAITPNLLM